MDNKAILSLLGLCLRGNHLAVGEEPVADAAQGCAVRLLVLSSDASEPTKRRAARFAREGQCLLVTLPATKAELGQALGRASAAMAAVTDLGLAGALANRLAQMDPAQYGEIAAKMDLKSRRAAERRKEHTARKEAEKRRSHPDEAVRHEDKKPSAPPRPPRREDGPSRKRRDDTGRASGPQGRDAQRRSSAWRTAGTGGARSTGIGKKRGAVNPYAHSRPVKKGKGSFRRKES